MPSVRVSAHVDYNVNNVKNVGDQSDQHHHMFIKAHVGNHGNEIANNLAKEATKNKEIMYNKIPKSQTVQQVKQQSIERWQTQWKRTTKGSTTKWFLPNIKERLKRDSS